MKNILKRVFADPSIAFIDWVRDVLNTRFRLGATIVSLYGASGFLFLDKLAEPLRAAERADEQSKAKLQAEAKKFVSHEDNLETYKANIKKLEESIKKVKTKYDQRQYMNNDTRFTAEHKAAADGFLEAALDEFNDRLIPLNQKPNYRVTFNDGKFEHPLADRLLDELLYPKETGNIMKTMNIKPTTWTR